MKIGVSLYSFHGYANPDSLGIKGCIDKVKELGGEGVDIVENATFATQEEYLAYAADIGAYIKEKGLEACCFCVGSDYIYGSNGDFDAEVERIKGKVDIAAAFGCKFIRHDSGPGFVLEKRCHSKGFDNALPIYAKAYRLIAEYAETKGVKTCVENHGFFCQDANRVEKLINAVAHPNFGALVDIGNFSCADENNAVSVGIMAPYAIHAHAKDFHIKQGNGDNPGTGFFMTRAGNYLRGSIIGHGDVPIRQCINALKRAGYDGFLNIEFEGMEDPIKGITVGIENLKKFIG